MKGNRSALVLVGFGSPEEPSDPSGFLFEIFSDPVASPLARWPRLMRPLARLAALAAARGSRRRYRAAIGRPTSASQMHGLSMRVAARLREMGMEGAEVLVAGRYGEPSIMSAIERAKGDGVSDLMLVPILPHRSRATTGTMEAELARTMSRAGPGLKARISRHLGATGGFAAAWAEAIEAAAAGFPADPKGGAHIIYCAHAVPIWPGGDDLSLYEEDVRESARAIGARLKISASASIAYQSRAPLGRWSGPTIGEELDRIARLNVRSCIIAPLSFLFDNVEVWCDIDERIVAHAGRFGMERIERAAPPIESPHIVAAIVEAAGMEFLR